MLPEALELKPCAINKILSIISCTSAAWRGTRRSAMWQLQASTIRCCYERQGL